MATAREHYESGDLAAAIAAQTADVKSHPSDVARRGFLADLLCVSGDLDRADKMLDAMSTQDPAIAVPVALIRQVIRAEVARREVFTSGRVPEFVDPPPAHISLHLKALAALRAGDQGAAAALLAEAEEGRPPRSGSVDDAGFEDFRDLDDVTSSFFEVLTSTGKYFWIPTERISEVVFHAPERPRDLVWRRCMMSVAGGPDGEVFVPATYPPSGIAADDRQRMGRATDWQGGDGTPVRGIGQRCFLAGDASLPILQIGTIVFGEAN